jgi:hypothetical protein
MTVLAGMFAGVVMAMVFLPHAAVVIVFNSRFASWPRADGSGPVAWLSAAFAAGSLLVWTGLGIAAAVLFTVARSAAPTHVPGVPSLAYLVGVCAVPALAAPWVALLAPRLWRHAAFEFAVFLAVFGVQIPMTVGID